MKNPENMTPREAADELSAQTWADERRERYADAIFDADGGGLISYAECEIMADAAMAVADEEISACEEYGRDWQRRYYSSVETYRDVTAEVHRLRAELESLRELLDVRSDYGVRMANLAAERNATIARVRGVLDECGGSESASTIVDEIRAALEGEQ